MKANEARMLSKAGRQLPSIYGMIRNAAKNGECSVKAHLTGQEIREVLVQDGYHLKDEIDDDSDYRGTWISWNG